VKSKGSTLLCVVYLIVGLIVVLHSDYSHPFVSGSSFVSSLLAFLFWPLVLILHLNLHVTI
jgi:hypothetical protein